MAIYPSHYLDIYLIRHGEKTEDGQALTPRGRAQARYFAKRMKGIAVKKMYSSDLPRCIETAQIIEKQLNVPVTYASALREVSAEVKEFPHKHKKEIATIQSFHRKLVKEKGNIVVVSSGIVNRILIALALGISPSNAHFIQNPTGLTHIQQLTTKRARMVHVNDTRHLPSRLNVRQAY